MVYVICMAQYVFCLTCTKEQTITTQQNVISIAYFYQNSVQFYVPVTINITPASSLLAS